MKVKQTTAAIAEQMDESTNKSLICLEPVRHVEQLPSELATPRLIDQAGGNAKFAWEEFVYGRIRNSGTRRAYCFAIGKFLDWSLGHRLELIRIAPAHIGRYLDEQTAYSAATKKLHLAALRHFFDELVLRHVIALNPALSVRSERLESQEGKTPEISIRQARQLLGSINISNVVGLRDKAVIAVMIYTAVRVGAVARLGRGDFYDLGDQYCLRFLEKRSKHRELPVRHDLVGLIRDYIVAAGLEYSDKASPLFRSTVRRTKQLTQNGMTSGDMSRMVKRRLRDAGLPICFSPHSFRVATITDLLTQGVPLEDVQLLAGHADPRTTRLYDRRSRKVTRNIVERISI